MDGTWVGIASKVQEEGVRRFGEESELGCVVWGYSLVKEGNFVLYC